MTRTATLSGANIALLVLSLVLGAMALLFLPFGAWFFYDGYIGYPREREVFGEFEAFRQGKPAETLSKEWNAYAATKGYPKIRPETGRPGKDHSDTDLVVQKIMGFLCTGIGFLMIVGSAVLGTILFVRKRNAQRRTT